MKNNIWKISFENLESCVYFIKINNKNILIDTSAEENELELIKSLKSIKINPEEVDVVLLTHNHYDHVGNIILFKNAKIYGSKEDFGNQLVLKNSLLSKISINFKFCKEHGINILDLNDLKMKEIEIIKTPGHTNGGVCFFLSKEKILFSGDTLFNHGFIGRTDFPNSSSKEMEISLKKLREIDYKILCPGHDY